MTNKSPQTEPESTPGSDPRLQARLTLLGTLPHGFDDDQYQRLITGLKNVVAWNEQLQAVPLQISDEPATIFRVYRAEK